jgi:thiamine biosynthesis lipoprotein
MLNPGYSILDAGYMMRKRIDLLYSLCVFFAFLCLTGCERRYKESEFLMSTMVEITAVGTEEESRQAMRLAFEEIRRIDSLMSVYNPDSEISRINEAAGKSAVRVSADTLKVINESLRIARLTDGALDITVAPLMELWGFGNDENRVPPDDELQEKLPLVDYTKILVDADSSTVRLDLPGMRIDVGGIAKGYAVDSAIRVMKEAGIRNALISAGGDIYAMGTPPGKESWRIGIRHPRDRSDLLGILALKDRAVATSGDYENFFEVDGKRYCHIMDTRTGRPVRGIMSVTILADTSAEADALATAVFPLGADKGMKLIESLEGVDGIIVTGSEADDMKIMMSSGLEGKIQLTTK